MNPFLDDIKDRISKPWQHDNAVSLAEIERLVRIAEAGEILVYALQLFADEDLIIAQRAIEEYRKATGEK